MRWLIILLSLFFMVSIYAEDNTTASNKKEEATEEIEVKGQSRNFNMKLILRSKKDKISFVKTRKNFREEILSTEP